MLLLWITVRKITVLKENFFLPTNSSFKPKLGTHEHKLTYSMLYFKQGIDPVRRKFTAVFMGAILGGNTDMKWVLLLCFCGDFASKFLEYFKFHVCLEAMVTRCGDKYCTNQGGPSSSVVTSCLVLSFKPRNPVSIFKAFRTQCKLIFKVF